METTNTKRYVEAVGRRKTAISRVRLTPASKQTFVVNDRDLASHFQSPALQEIVLAPLAKAALTQKFAVTAKITGGGIHAQAEAMRHSIARALLKVEETLRKDLKRAGYLKRDPRTKERRKFGLKKARKAPQWAKR